MNSTSILFNLKQHINPSRLKQSQTVYSRRHTSSWLWGSKSSEEKPVQEQVKVEDKVPEPIPKRLPKIKLEIHKPVEKVSFDELPTFEEKSKLSWKTPFLHSWLQTLSGSISGIILLNRSIFGAPLRSDILSSVLTYERSWLEAGTESTKALGQVRGSTRKFAPQKGRGKARVGTFRAPQWKGGYNVHGPRPHDKTIGINRKVYDQGIRIALSTKFAQDQMRIVDSFSTSPGPSFPSALKLKTPFQPKLTPGTSHKTPLIDTITSLGLLGKKIYFVHGEDLIPNHLIRLADTMTEKNKALGERAVMVSHATQVSAMSLLEYDALVMDLRAVEVLEQMYAKENRAVGVVSQAEEQEKEKKVLLEATA